MQNKWINDNEIYRFTNLADKQYDKLPVGVYNINLDRNGFFLTKIFNTFEFNYKLYDVNNKIDYITQYYNATSGNLGILFNGLKGSGRFYC